MLTLMRVCPVFSIRVISIVFTSCSFPAADVERITDGMERISQMLDQRGEPGNALSGHDLASLQLSQVREAYILPLSIAFYPEIASVQITPGRITFRFFFLCRAIYLAVVVIASHRNPSLSESSSHGMKHHRRTCCYLCCKSRCLPCKAGH